MNKILCPFHDEDTPSCQVYDTHFHCYGCGAHGALSDLPKEVSNYPFQKSVLQSSYKEDLDKTLDKISKLTTKVVRGFALPVDDTGYYLVYPNAKYYVKRLWDGTSANKYRCPLGHKKPLFAPTAESTNTLLVVEGQLNALTLSKLYSKDVVSPGGCNDLAHKSFIPYYLQYNKICIIVDKDAAGVVSALELKAQLLKHNKRVAIYAMPKDLNAVYVEEGEEAARKCIKEAMDLL